jgi:hypothetical protein
MKYLNLLSSNHKKVVVFIFLIIISLCIYSQVPIIDWQRCYGGSDIDRAIGYNNLISTIDGGYIFSSSPGSFDGDLDSIRIGTLWIVKTDSIGNIIWQKNYGGSGFEGPESTIIKNNEGGFTFAVASYSNDHDVSGNHGGDDVWLGKIDSAGNLLWQKSYGGTDNDIPFALKITSDGGYIVAGETYSNDFDVQGNHDTTGIESDVWVLKIDSAGNIEWQKCLGGVGTDKAFDIQVTSDSDYIVVGWEQSGDNGDVNGSHGARDIWVIKLNHFGILQWQKCYGGSFIDEGYSIRETPDNGFIVAGSTGSVDGDVININGDFEYWLFKINSTGIIQWQKSYGGSRGELAFAFTQTGDGGYYLTGATSSFDGEVSGLHGDTIWPNIHSDYWVIKVDSIGTLQWQICLGGSQADIAYSLTQTPDSNCIILGYSASVDGDITFTHGNMDLWLVKLKQLQNKIPDYPFNNSFFSCVIINGILNLNITSDKSEDIPIYIYNGLGELIISKNYRLQWGQNNISIPCPSLSLGVYFIYALGITKKVIVSE